MSQAMLDNGAAQMLVIGLSASGMVLFFGLATLAWRFEKRRAFGPPKPGEIEAPLAARAPVHGPRLDAATELQLFSERVARVEAAHRAAKAVAAPVVVAETLLGPNDGDTEFIERDEILDRAVHVL